MWLCCSCLVLVGLLWCNLPLLWLALLLLLMALVLLCCQVGRWLPWLWLLHLCAAVVEQSLAETAVQLGHAAVAQLLLPVALGHVTAGLAVGSSVHTVVEPSVGHQAAVAGFPCLQLAAGAAVAVPAAVSSMHRIPIGNPLQCHRTLH